MSNTPTQTLTCPRCGSDKTQPAEINAPGWMCWNCDKLLRNGPWNESDVAALRSEVRRLRSGLKRFLNPEDMGLSVSAWVRDTVREILGQPMVERMPPGPTQSPKE